MRVVVAQEASDGPPRGQAGVEASVKLLKWIGDGGLKATHPEFDEIAGALSSQGAFARLALHVTANQFETRLHSLSLNAQNAAAERTSLLPEGFDQLNSMRIEALRIVLETRPLMGVTRGSKAWYQREVAKRDQEIQDLINQKAFLTSAVQEYMSCARRFAAAAGMGREFDKLQVTLLKKYGPIAKVNV
jgi:hypothetical protein